MFGRRRREPGAQPTKTGPIGIGAQVVVLPDPSASDQWEGEPSGVVVAPGDNNIVAYPGLTFGGPTRWLVAFDELQFTADGRGPFEQATVGSWRLVPVPQVEAGTAE
jgi:hypothetical protein